jgi:hypothetical protein
MFRAIEILMGQARVLKDEMKDDQDMSKKISKSPIGEKDHVSDTSAPGSGYQLYQAAFKADVFNGLPEGTWVAYNNGQLVATAEDNDALLRLLDMQKLSGDIFISKVEVQNQRITAP